MSPRTWAASIRAWTSNIRPYPYFGFYHASRHGKPSFALDMMEEFRAVIADSVVLTLINNGTVRPKDFLA